MAGLVGREEPSHHCEKFTEALGTSNTASGAVGRNGIRRILVFRPIGN
jgi:hypothetical protein